MSYRTSKCGQRVAVIETKMRVEACAPTRMKDASLKLELERVTEAKLHLAGLTLDAGKI
jgi:hypothetical protein